MLTEYCYKFLFFSSHTCLWIMQNIYNILNEKRGIKYRYVLILHIVGIIKGTSLQISDILLFNFARWIKILKILMVIHDLKKLCLHLWQDRMRFPSTTFFFLLSYFFSHFLFTKDPAAVNFWLSNILNF